MCSNSQNLLLKKPRKANITFLRTIEDALLYLYFTATFMIKLWGLVPCLLLISCLESRETKVQRFLIQSNDMVKKQNLEQAERFLLEALKIDSCFADAWNNLGTIYFDQRKYDQAIHYYDNAVRCNPTFFDGYFNRANAAFEANEHYRALKDLETLERNYADTARVFFLKGLVLTRLRKFDDALHSLRKAFTLDKRNSEILVNLGTVHYYKNEFDSATYYLNRSIEMNPNEANAFNALAMVEVELKNYDRALDLVNNALSKQSRDPYFLNNRGYIFLQSNQMEKAIQDIDLSITLDPYNGWAYRNKGIYYLINKRYDDAIRLLQRAESSDPFIQDLYFYLGEAYHKSNNKAQACTYYAKALERREMSLQDFEGKCK